MLRADLEVARARWIAAAGKESRERANREASDRLVPERHNGASVSFHSLRYTLAFNLATAGVSVQKARTLMRHSTIQLTCDLYGELGFGDVDDALDALPDLSAAIG